MPDLRPRLVKTAKPTPAPVAAQPVAVASTKKPRKVTKQQVLNKLSHHEHRMRKLKMFEDFLIRRTDLWVRRFEALPYYRAMIASRQMRTRPLSDARKRWIFSVDIYLAARELFRLEYNQHCESVSWSPDNTAK